VAAPLTVALATLGAAAGTIVMTGHWHVGDPALFTALTAVGLATAITALVLPPRPQPDATSPAVRRSPLPLPTAAAGTAVIAVLIAARGGLVAVLGIRAVLVDILGMLLVSVIVAWTLSPSWALLRYDDADRRPDRWAAATLGFAAGLTVYLTGGIEAQVSPDRTRSFAALTGFTVTAVTAGLQSMRRRSAVTARSHRDMRSRQRVMISWMIAAVPIAELAGRGPDVWLSTVQLAIVAVVLFMFGQVLSALGPGWREPRRVGPRLRDAAPVIVPATGQAAVVGALVGLAAPTVFVPLSWPLRWAAGQVPWTIPAPVLPSPTSLALFVLAGALTGLIIGLLRWVLAPVEHGTAEGPRAVLHTDAVVLCLLLATAAVIAVPLAVVLVRQHPQLHPLIPVSAVVLLILPVLVAAARTSAWLQYRTAHLCLAVARRLPWRFMRLLQQARDAGLLRRSGSAYQFRHVRLLEHLRPLQMSPAASPQRWPIAAWAPVWKGTATAITVLLLFAAGAVRQAVVGPAGPGTAVTLAAPDVAALRGQGVCPLACRVTGHVMVGHPAWGPVTVSSVAAPDPAAVQAFLVVTDRSGRVRWQWGYGGWRTLTVVSRDRSGNVFAVATDAQGTSVVVIRPEQHSFAQFGTDDLPWFDDSRLVDDGDGDGLYAIDHAVDGCLPACGKGDVYHQLYYWTGKAYRP
jgi:hypothetical protein